MRDLAMHLLDLVQNSIEAGAKQVELILCENKSANLFTLTVRDNGRGMTEEKIRQVLDPFVTTRITRKVGLGLPLMDMSTRQCGGSLTIESEVGKGTTVTASYPFDHLDRPPLGNIEQTVRTLLVANPELDFRFEHQVEDKKFVLATQDIVAILGNIPLTQPEVLLWLDEYIEEQLKNLYGGVKGENT